MPKYVIERLIPGAGKMTADELKAISMRSCDVLNQMGPRDPVDPELRHGQQDLLRLHRAERGDGARARAHGRVPGESRRVGEDADRSDDRRSTARRSPAAHTALRINDRSTARTGKGLAQTGERVLWKTKNGRRFRRPSSRLVAIQQFPIPPGQMSELPDLRIPRFARDDADRASNRTSRSPNPGFNTGNTNEHESTRIEPISSRAASRHDAT